MYIVSLRVFVNYSMVVLFLGFYHLLALQFRYWYVGCIIGASRPLSGSPLPLPNFFFLLLLFFFFSSAALAFGKS